MNVAFADRRRCPGCRSLVRKSTKESDWRDVLLIDRRGRPSSASSPEGATQACHTGPLWTCLATARSRCGSTTTVAPTSKARCREGVAADAGLAPAGRPAFRYRVGVVPGRRPRLEHRVGCTTSPYLDGGKPTLAIGRDPTVRLLVGSASSDAQDPCRLLSTRRKRTVDQGFRPLSLVATSAPSRWSRVRASAKRILSPIGRLDAGSRHPRWSGGQPGRSR